MHVSTPSNILIEPVYLISNNRHSINSKTILLIAKVGQNLSRKYVLDGRLLLKLEKQFQNQYERRTCDRFLSEYFIMFGTNNS